MSDDLRTGLLVLHGNRLELLAQAVSQWLGRAPLAPLETETLLVQSNAMGEWLKMHLAQAHGVCAATVVELPARFLWRAYRAVLGEAQVPEPSPLDKDALTWRLMGLLPSLRGETVFDPLQQFLKPPKASPAPDLPQGSAGDEGLRCLQLAQRLADLFDAYQVHRGDWLLDWQEGREVLRSGLGGSGPAVPVPQAQRWQPALWRRLIESLGSQQRLGGRSAVHRRFLQALREASTPPGGRALPDLPRRIVLFGTTNLPLQTLEAIAAMAAHCQVLIAVPNPCRHHWADTLSGRELLGAQRRRHGLRHGIELQAVSMQQMHLHAHPLLSAWGRQSRDFVRLLDAFDDAEAARTRFAMPRLDLFDDSPSSSLLQQVQAAMRDLVPLQEHARVAPPADDRSIVFHVAHGPQREVEVLHDQLLHLLAHPPGQEPLAPRDIVVMVPDIESFAPAIRSVFGQHPRGDARAIAWGIADQKDRGRHPLLLALDWLMSAPHQRFAASQVRALLEVPALARRLSLQAEDLELLDRWIEQAGVRWGLDARQRASLGLALEEGEGGAQNTWVFGLRRMLLGYAAGEIAAASGAETAPAQGYAGIEPYAEVAGLEAEVAGALDHLLQMLLQWWSHALQPRSPRDWGARLEQLMQQFFAPTDAGERALMQSLQAALAGWLQHCETAGFDEAVGLEVVREAWLGAVDEPGIGQRFRAGGVTFCTLLPMRAIPFSVVCLLGMNDGDYPRRASRGDFDLMSLPGHARPGDRSRRDDDRQLMLDALLSARKVLYISWSGQGLRDPGPRPASVLVEQLRDYLRAGWGDETVTDRTTLHPRQPFSSRYFAPEGPLFTYAAEWRKAHVASPHESEHESRHASHCNPQPASAPQSCEAPAAPARASVQVLGEFLRNPVKAFFRHRLRVRLDEPCGDRDDDEPFDAQGLSRWTLMDTLLRECRKQLGPGRAAPGQAPVGDRAASVEHVLRRQIERLARAGRLPLAGPGRRVRQDLLATLRPMVERWLELLEQHPPLELPLELVWTYPEPPAPVFEDCFADLRVQAGHDTPIWVDLSSSRVAEASRAGKAKPRPERMASAWVRCLASAACGRPLQAVVIGEGGLVRARSPSEQTAGEQLRDLMLAWHEGMSGHTPWPIAMATGLAVVEGDMKRARQAYEGQDLDRRPGEVRDPSLARLYPDFEHLSTADGFHSASQRLYAPYRQWLDDCCVAEAWSATDDDEAEGDD